MGIALGVILLLTVSYSALSRMMGPTEETAALLQGGTPKAVGTALFTKYVLPFELIALLLLVALIGALVLGRQQEGAGEGIASLKANE